MKTLNKKEIEEICKNKYIIPYLSLYESDEILIFIKGYLIGKENKNPNKLLPMKKIKKIIKKLQNELREESIKSYTNICKN